MFRIGYWQTNRKTDGITTSISAYSGGPYASGRPISDTDARGQPSWIGEFVIFPKGIRWSSVRDHRAPFRAAQIKFTILSCLGRYVGCRYSLWVWGCSSPLSRSDIIRQRTITQTAAALLPPRYVLPAPKTANTAGRTIFFFLPHANHHHHSSILTDDRYSSLALSIGRARCSHLGRFITPLSLSLSKLRSRSLSLSL